MVKSGTRNSELFNFEHLRISELGTFQISLTKNSELGTFQIPNRHRNSELGTFQNDTRIATTLGACLKFAAFVCFVVGVLVEILCVVVFPRALLRVLGRAPSYI